MEAIACEPSRIQLSNHSVERFRERFRPALEWPSAKRELLRLLGCGSVVREAPAWLAERAQQGAERYLTVGEDLVLPLVYDERLGAWIARTCLGRGGVSAPARQRRNEAGRRRRQARRRSGGRGGRDARARAERIRSAG